MRLEEKHHLRILDQLVAGGIAPGYSYSLRGTQLFKQGRG
jgi:hypothetical protein